MGEAPPKEFWKVMENIEEVMERYWGDTGFIISGRAQNESGRLWNSIGQTPKNDSVRSWKQVGEVMKKSWGDT